MCMLTTLSRSVKTEKQPNQYISIWNKENRSKIRKTGEKTENIDIQLRNAKIEQVLEFKHVEVVIKNKENSNF